MNLCEWILYIAPLGPQYRAPPLHTAQPWITSPLFPLLYYLWSMLYIFTSRSSSISIFVSLIPLHVFTIAPSQTLYPDPSSFCKDRPCLAGISAFHLIRPQFRQGFLFFRILLLPRQRQPVPITFFLCLLGRRSNYMPLGQVRTIATLLPSPTDRGRDASQGGCQR